MALRHFYCDQTGEYATFSAFIVYAINEVYGSGHAAYSGNNITITNCFGRVSETITLMYGTTQAFSNYPLSIGIDADKNFLIAIVAKYHTGTHYILDRIPCILYDDDDIHRTLDITNCTLDPFLLPNTSANFSYTNIIPKNLSFPEPSKIYLTRIMIGNTALSPEVQVSNYSFNIGAQIEASDGSNFFAIGEDILYLME